MLKIIQTCITRWFELPLSLASIRCFCYQLQYGSRRAWKTTDNFQAQKVFLWRTNEQRKSEKGAHMKISIKCFFDLKQWIWKEKIEWNSIVTSNQLIIWRINNKSVFTHLTSSSRLWDIPSTGGEMRKDTFTLNPPFMNIILFDNQFVQLRRSFYYFLIDCEVDRC